MGSFWGAIVFHPYSSLRGSPGLSPPGLEIGSPVPAGESDKRADPGWYVDPDPYTVWTARSSANLVHAAEVSLGA